VSNMNDQLMLSVIIPAYNEGPNLAGTISSIYDELNKHNIEHEILVVNDHSTDDTIDVLNGLMKNIPTLKMILNPPPNNGFGYAIRKGLENYKGECVAIFMADLSDDPVDLIKFYNKLVEQNLDCVFGNRFIKGGSVKDYPKIKYIVNRLFNTIIRLFIDSGYNDYTNAFKLYRKHTIDGLQPLVSKQFNLTIELPLKAIIRGYTFAIVPNSWKNRQVGISNLRISEMGSRYFWIFVRCLIEKYFGRKVLGKRF